MKQNQVSKYISRHYKKDCGLKQYVEQCTALIWACLQRQTAFHLSLQSPTSTCLSLYMHSLSRSIHPLWTFSRICVCKI